MQDPWSHRSRLNLDTDCDVKMHIDYEYKKQVWVTKETTERRYTRSFCLSRRISVMNIAAVCLGKREGGTLRSVREINEMTEEGWEE